MEIIVGQIKERKGTMGGGSQTKWFPIMIKIKFGSTLNFPLHCCYTERKCLNDSRYNNLK